MISIFFPTAGVAQNFNGNSVMGGPVRGQAAPTPLPQTPADGFTPSEEMLELGYQLGFLVGKLARQAQLAQMFGSQPQNKANQVQGPAAAWKGGQAGKVIELKEGDTFTTPGGATIAWKGDEVKVNEPGGRTQQAAASGAAAQQNGKPNGPQNGPRGGRFQAALSMSTASSAEGRQFAVSMALSLAVRLAGCGHDGALQSAGTVPMGAASAALAAQSQETKPRNWRVWGDPHIDHPNGSKSDFDRKNAMFTLQDGTRVLMGADNPQAVVKKVQIVLPGGEPNWQGYDPKDTSVMEDDGTGHFKSVGTAEQLLAGRTA